MVAGIFGGMKGYGSVHAADLLVAMFSLWTRLEQTQNNVNKNPRRDLVLKRPEGVEDRGWRPEINSLGPSTGDAAGRAWSNPWPNGRNGRDGGPTMAAGKACCPPGAGID